MSLYLAVEGPDGCGKSTQASRLVGWLESNGVDVLALREPGSTPLGEMLREVLLNPETGDLSVAAEALLFSAARAEMVVRQVLPALRSGQVVVAERSYVSTQVYQAIAGGAAVLTPEFLQQLAAVAHGDALPDRIFVLDVDYDTARQRQGDAALDRIEGRGREYHEKVRAGYLEVARQDGRIEVFDGARDADELQAELVARVAMLLEESR